MKKSVAMKWAKALESGKYEQGAAVLYDEQDNTYCCLGVLCKIYKIKHPKGSGELPLKAIQKFKMNGPFGERGSKKSLAELNDKTFFTRVKGKLIPKGHSFKYIAKIIRKEWKDL